MAGSTTSQSPPQPTPGADQVGSGTTSKPAGKQRKRKANTTKPKESTTTGGDGKAAENKGKTAMKKGKPTVVDPEPAEGGDAKRCMSTRKHTRPPSPAPKTVAPTGVHVDQVALGPDGEPLKKHKYVLILRPT